MVSYKFSLFWRYHPNQVRFENRNLRVPLSLGIPVKYFPEGEEVIKPVQYAALFSDLVKHTRFALKQLEIND